MMKKAILTLLHCPSCVSSLTDSGDYLICKSCDIKYPVIDGNMVVFLSRKNLQEFGSEGVGEEYLSEDYGAFLTRETSLADLENMLQKETQKAEKEKKDRELYKDDSLEDELTAALDKSRDVLINKIETQNARTILDCPTGPGFFLTKLNENISNDSVVFAVDINFGRLSRTRGYFSNHPNKENLVFIVSDALKLPFRNKSFDAVTSWGIVDVPNQSDFMKEISTLLKAKGKLGFTADQYKEDSESMKIAENLKIADVVSRKRIESLLKREGIKMTDYEMLWEGQDTDFDVPDEDRCPLPARGDYYQFVAAIGQKMEEV